MKDHYENRSFPPPDAARYLGTSNPSWQKGDATATGHAIANWEGASSIGNPIWILGVRSVFTPLPRNIRSGFRRQRHPRTNHPQQ